MLVWSYQNYKEKIMGLCKDLWDRYNPFDIHKYIEKLNGGLEEVKQSIKAIDNKLEDEIDHIEWELAFNKGLLNILAETIPDMLWLKGADGRYLYANNKIREGLLFCNPIGKDDIECSVKAKEKFGADNHTFGDICGNSDKIVIETMKPQRFMESGMIKGKMTYLDVYKAPFIVNGVFIGVCGVGRDMTPYVEAYNKNGCSKCPMDEEVRNIFDMFKFDDRDKQ